MAALWNRADHYIFILSFVMAALRAVISFISNSLRREASQSDNRSFATSQLRNFVFSERELTFTFAIARWSVCRLSSVTFVHPTQAVVIFRNISTALGTMAIH